MIDPAAILQIAGDMGALTRHGGDLSQVGTAFADTGARVHTGWQGLAGCYLAPEAGQLFAATGPVQGTSASVGEDLRSAGSALITYAGEVTGIQTRLRTLQTEAFEFVAFAAANPDWLSNQVDVDRHNQLLAAVDAQVLAFEDAERRCANAILALYSDRRFVPDNGDGVLEANEHGLTPAALAALAQEGELPWGAPEALDRGFLGDVGDFFTGVGEGIGDGGGRFVGGLVEAGEGAVVGAGMLVGYADGGFDGDAALTAWAGLGALAANFTPVGYLDQFVDLPFMPRGMAQETLLNTVGALTAYDVWGQDPARAAGLVTGNLLLAVLGPKGVGAGLRGGGAAAARSAVPAVARAGGGLVRAGEALGRLPTVSDVVGGVLDRLRGLEVPRVELPDADLPSTHADAPGARADGPDAAPAPSGSPLAPERIPPPVVREAPLESRALDQQYVGENVPNNPASPFYPKVVQYFDEARQAEARVVVVDGRLYWAEMRTPVDTAEAISLHNLTEPRAIFVQDASGNLFVELKQKYGRVHHSSLLAGQPVANAGELVVVNGVPTLMNRKSGHYKPTDAQQANGVAALSDQGLDMSQMQVEGGF